VSCDVTAFLNFMSEDIFKRRAYKTESAYNCKHVRRGITEKQRVNGINWRQKKLMTTNENKNHHKTLIETLKH
jgi:hypothetical protein